MQKLSQQFIVTQYRSGIESYSQFTTEVGIWDSEKYVFEKYLQKDDSILDLGCGTGRTTFALYQLGYTNIIGLDLTPEMIAEANKLNTHFKTSISFIIGDATDLPFGKCQFDAVIFSFNGIMSIPQSSKRKKAFEEISRVLKRNGKFIFTTHDREADENYFEFWKEQEKIWQAGQQRKELYEFGDLITSSKNESSEIFIHIPNKAEVIKLFEKEGFQLLETFYRNEKFDESPKVKEKSGECRFWILKKL